MRIWVIQEGEPISFVDGNNRLFRTEMLVNRLVARGHSVLRWSSTFDYLRKTFRFCDGRDIELGSSLRYLFLHSPTAYKKNISLAHFRHNREIQAAFSLQAVDERVPELIFCSIPSLPLAVAASEYAHRYHVPLVMDVRDDWPDSFLDNQTFLRRMVWRFLLRRENYRLSQILHQASAITAISQAHLNWALRKAGRCHGPWDAVFPIAHEEPPRNFFEDEKQRLNFYGQIGARPDQSLVTCIGRIGSAFDFELVVKLARQYLAENRHDIHFVLVGEGPVRRLLKKKCPDLPNLAITGWVNQRHLQRILAITDVGLLPYKSIHSPTIRNKPLDFLSMGIPVLSSLRGEVEDLIREYNIGLSYANGNLLDFRKSLDYLLEHKRLRMKMKQQALTCFHSLFSATKIYPAFAEFLESFRENWKDDGKC